MEKKRKKQGLGLFRGSPAKAGEEQICILCLLTILACLVIHPVLVTIRVPLALLPWPPSIADGPSVPEAFRAVLTFRALILRPLLPLQRDCTQAAIPCLLFFPWIFYAAPFFYGFLMPDGA
jgi:hypothetical protein